MGTRRVIVIWLLLAVCWPLVLGGSLQPASGPSQSLSSASYSSPQQANTNTAAVAAAAAAGGSSGGVALTDGGKGSSVLAPSTGAGGSTSHSSGVTPVQSPPTTPPPASSTPNANDYVPDPTPTVQVDKVTVPVEGGYQQHVRKTISVPGTPTIPQTEKPSVARGPLALPLPGLPPCGCHPDPCHPTCLAKPPPPHQPECGCQHRQQPGLEGVSSVDTPVAPAAPAPVAASHPAPHGDLNIGFAGIAGVSSVKESAGASLSSALAGLVAAGSGSSGSGNSFGAGSSGSGGSAPAGASASAAAAAAADAAAASMKEHEYVKQQAFNGGSSGSGSGSGSGASFGSGSGATFGSGSGSGSQMSEAAELTPESPNQRSSASSSASASAGAAALASSVFGSSGSTSAAPADATGSMLGSASTSASSSVPPVGPPKDTTQGGYPPGSEFARPSSSSSSSRVDSYPPITDYTPSRVKLEPITSVHQEVGPDGKRYRVRTQINRERVQMPAAPTIPLEDAALLGADGSGPAGGSGPWPGQPGSGPIGVGPDGRPVFGHGGPPAHGCGCDPHVTCCNARPYTPTPSTPCACAPHPVCCPAQKEFSSSSVVSNCRAQPTSCTTPPIVSSAHASAPAPPRGCSGSSCWHFKDGLHGPVEEAQIV